MNFTTAFLAANPLLPCFTVTIDEETVLATSDELAHLEREHGRRNVFATALL